MKTLKQLLAVFFIFISTLSFAQKNVEVLERNMNMSLGARNGFSIAFEDMSKKDLKGKFEDYMSQYGKKISMEEISKTEYKLNDVIISFISEAPIDIYILFEEGKKGTTMTGFFDMGDMFVSSVTQPIKYKDAEMFMRKFAWRLEKMKVQEKYDAANKQLSKKQDEQKDLEKKNTSLNKDIEDCNATIEKAKADIQQNNSDQQSKKKEIADQQKSLDEINTELKQYEQY